MIFYEVTTVGEALEVYHNNSLCIVDQQRMLKRSETTILVPPQIMTIHVCGSARNFANREFSSLSRITETWCMQNIAGRLKNGIGIKEKTGDKKTLHR